MRHGNLKIELEKLLLDFKEFVREIEKLSSVCVLPSQNNERHTCAKCLRILVRLSKLSINRRQMHFHFVETP